MPRTQQSVQIAELEKALALAIQVNQSRGKRHPALGTIEVDNLTLNQFSAAIALYEDEYGEIAQPDQSR